MGELAPVGQVSKVKVEAGMAIFAFISISLILGGIYNLFKKTFHSRGIERAQYKFVLVGAFTTFVLLGVFNLVLPGIFLNVRFIPLGALFIFPFIAFTSYAILKHHLLNVKVIATELLTFALWLTLLVITINTSSLGDMILHSAVLIAAILLGVFLIRSVMREVETREKMEDMAVKLDVANEELKRLDVAKSDFISIASHQLRSPLTIIKGYISMIREGTYGVLPEKIADPLQKVYVSNERLINLVSDLLDLSRMERGKMQYDF